MREAGSLMYQAKVFSALAAWECGRRHQPMPAELLATGWHDSSRPQGRHNRLTDINDPRDLLEALTHPTKQ